MKRLGIILKLILIGMLSISLIAPFGCSSSRRTETTVVRDSSPYASERVIERKTTTTVEDKDNDGCGGVLSCTVDVVGAIIALPFKAVGALIGAIF